MDAQIALRVASAQARLHSALHVSQGSISQTQAKSRAHRVSLASTRTNLENHPALTVVLADM